MPGDFEGTAQIGTSLTELGRLDEAERYLRDALMGVDDARTHYNLGVVLSGLNRSAKRAPNTGGRSTAIRISSMRETTSPRSSRAKDAWPKRAPSSNEYCSSSPTTRGRWPTCASCAATTNSVGLGSFVASGFSRTSCSCRVLQEQDCRGGVGHRDVVLPGPLDDTSGQGRSHGEPRRELSVLCAAQAHDVGHGITGKRDRIVDELIEAQLIELGVEKAGALAVGAGATGRQSR